MKSKIANNNLAVAIFIMLFVPFLGRLGSLVFTSTGKYLYFLMAIFLLADMFIRMIYFDSIWVHALQEMLFFSAIILVTLAFGNNVNNIGIAIVLIVFFFYFMNIDANDEFLLRLGKISFCIYMMFTVITFVPQLFYLHFNTNSYGFVAFCLYAWSCFYILHLPKLKKILLLTLNTVIFMLMFKFKYPSETQVLSLMVLILTFILKNVIRKNRWFYNAYITAVFGFAFFLPLVTMLLIKYGVLTGSFLSSRGFRWISAFKALTESGLLKVSAAEVGAHNGFLEMCLQYNVITTLIVTAGLLVISFKGYPAVKEGKSGYILFAIFASCIFMNASEAIIVNMSFGYFMFMSLGMLVSRSNSISVPEPEIISPYAANKCT